VTGADVLQALADDDLDAMACCRCVLNSRFGLRPYDRWEQEGGEREAGRVGELWREAAERIACEDPAHLNPPFWLVTAARALTGRLPEGDRPAALALVDEDRTRDEARSAFRLLRPLLAEALASIAGRYPFDAHQKRPGCARED